MVTAKDQKQQLLEEFQKELEETIIFVQNFPRMLEESVRRTMDSVIDAPIIAATRSLRGFRDLLKESTKIPEYVLEDIRDTPELLFTFISKAPSESRKEIRDYLTWKKTERPLNLIDLIVDILDTIIPG